MQIAHRVGEAGFVQHNNKDCFYGTLKLLQGSEMKIQESKSYVPTAELNQETVYCKFLSLQNNWHKSMWKEKSPGCPQTCWTSGNRRT